MPLPGFTKYTQTTTASTNAASIAAAPATLLQASVVNPTAGAIFVKFADTAAAPIPGTTIPQVTIQVAAGAAPLPILFGTGGLPFTTGLGIWITGAIGDLDATATAAGAHVALTYC